MPVPFSLLPELIRISIVQKQDIRDFLQFHVCSRESYETAKTVQTRFTVRYEEATRSKWSSYDWTLNAEVKEWEYLLNFLDKSRFSISDERVINSRVRFSIEGLDIYEDMSTECCERLKEFLIITNSSIDKIDFHNFEGFKGTVDQFNALLHASKASRLHITSRIEITLELLTVPAMKQVKIFYASCPLTMLTDAEILAVKAPSICVKNADITSGGLNSILTEWLRGEREISNLAIPMGSGIARERDWVFFGIPYVNKDVPKMSDMISVVERENDKKKIVVKFYYNHSLRRFTYILINPHE